MRFALLPFLLFIPSLAACAAPEYWVGGTVDYATSSPLDRGPRSTGALPLRVLYCAASFEEDATHSPMRPPLVRLGDGCVLDLSHGGGTCDLPTGTTSSIRITVENLSAAFAAYNGYRGYRRFDAPLTVVVGGITVEGGHYVTYRFTGSDLQKATDDECDAAARAMSKPAPPPEATANASAEYWAIWRNGKLELPPAGTGR
jgi:hypothetical protein